MRKSILTILMFAGLLLMSCKNSSTGQNSATGAIPGKTGRSLKESTELYNTGNLILKKLSPHVYQHISFLNTKDFGKVDCNGMIVVNENEAIVFDTPADDKSSEELINYVTKTLQCKIKAIIPTHFHEDCVGGLEKFNEYNVPAYASNKTIALLNSKNKKFSKPIEGFNDSLSIPIGDKIVNAAYFGEGHTRDNIIGYFAEDNIMFGGCLVKASGASKGNLEDANTNAWPGTIRKLHQKYPQARIVIPGHGQPGGPELLDYTIHLFE
jgi:metallo-beta-lactamase class B